MKNLLTAIMLLVMSSLLAGLAYMPTPEGVAGEPGRETGGTLSFSVRTVTYHGQYAPRNSGAIWITNAANQFIKTIKVWAIPYRYTLIRWNASSGGNTTGAITGASLNNHQLHNVTWNGTDSQGNQAPDGDYKVNVEFTEHNATPTNLGKFKQVTFSKGSAPVTLTIPNEAYFTDMALTWQPVIQNGLIAGYVRDGQSNPIPQASLQAGSYSVQANAAGYYSLSVPPGNYDLTCSAPGFAPQTVYGVTVSSGLVATQDFLLETVGAADELSPLAEFGLGNPSPNPFSSICRISLAGKGGIPLELQIFNFRGQVVRNLAIGPSGEANWDGRDDRGLRCPRGSYLIRLSQGGKVAVRKVQLLY